ncbi:hypothetical protein DH2020_024456 [Rehmannia glutinosa]|uniref:DUF1985 domain-containing protein n=1 Tax=Rehmannia glutinosa TaxID=99300 RepID=A0ABR0W553_REHGL
MPNGHPPSQLQSLQSRMKYAIDPEFWYDSRVSVRCNLESFGKVYDILTDEYKERLLSSCFANFHYMNKGIKFSGKLLNSLLVRRIIPKDVVGIVDDDEIWFTFGGSSKACFSLREFTLITGLKPGNEEEYKDNFPGENRLERKYFNARKIVSVGELESTILERVEDEEDKYKLGLVWEYESIPSIANLFQASMTKDKIPRMRKWKSSLTLGQSYISDILDSPNVKVYAHLTPSPEEKLLEYIRFFGDDASENTQPNQGERVSSQDVLGDTERSCQPNEDVRQPLPTSSTHRRPTAPITGRHILDAILALTEKVNALDRKVESILEMRHQALLLICITMMCNVHRTLSPPPMHDEEIDMTIDRAVDVASNVTKEKVSEQVVEVLVGDVAKRVGAEEEGDHEQQNIDVVRIQKEN